MKAEIFTEEKTPFTLLVHNASKELTVWDKENNCVTIYTDEKSLVFLRNLINEKLTSLQQRDEGSRKE